MSFQHAFGIEDKNGSFFLFLRPDHGISSLPSLDYQINEYLKTVSDISEETDLFGAVGKVNTLSVVLDNTHKQMGKLIFEQANLFNLNRIFVYEVENKNWTTKDAVFNGRIDSMSFLGTEIKLNLR